MRRGGEGEGEGREREGEGRGEEGRRGERKGGRRGEGKGAAEYIENFPSTFFLLPELLEQTKSDGDDDTDGGVLSTAVSLILCTRLAVYLIRNEQ